MNITLLLMLLVAAETTYLTARTFKKRADVPKQSILLDTSVLIDGRIESIARSGLITSPLLIPQAVVRELQYMADKADHDKRERARQGLDMIDKLQHIEVVTVRVFDSSSASETGVDELLVELAAKYDARLCTTDYNLNKAAKVQGITVLNINEIAHALRVVHLPGEIVTLVMQKTGQERDQGVGYLDDGTMVVVDNGKKYMDKAVDVEVTRVLQTVAGKMMFAKLVSVSQKQVLKSPKVVSGKTSRKPSEQTSKMSMSSQDPSEQVSRNASSTVTKPAVSQPSVSETTTRSVKPNKEKPMNQKPQQPRKSPNQTTQQNNASKPSTPQSSRAPQKRKRKSMTDRAEDSLVNLLNNQQ